MLKRQLARHLRAVPLFALLAVLAPTTIAAWSTSVDGVDVIALGSSGTDRVNGVAMLANGGFVAVGGAGGDVDLDPGSSTTTVNSGNSNENGFIAWYDADGVLTGGFGLGNSSSATSVITDVEIVDNIEMVVVTGYFTNGTIDLEPGAYADTRTAGAGEFRHFIAAYEVDMTQVWAHDWPSGSPFAIEPLLAADGSHIYFSTTVDSTGADLDRSASTATATAAAGSPSVNAVVASYDFGGQYEWHGVIEATMTSRIGDIEVGGSGVVASGFGGGTIDLDTSGATEQISSTWPQVVPFIVSLDSGGSFGWGTQVTSAVDQPNFGAIIAVAPSGDIVATGEFGASDTIDYSPCPPPALFCSHVPATFGDVDIYVNTYGAADGVQSDSATLGSSGPDAPYDISFDDDGALVLLGAFGPGADLNPGAAEALTPGGYSIVAYSSADLSTYEWSTTTPSIPTLARHMGDGINLIAGSFNSFGAADIDPSPSRLVPVSLVGGLDGFVAFIDRNSPPTVTSTDIAEVDGAGGETITLTGSGFVDGMTVEIENAGACTDVTVVSSASLTCTTPASDAGTWDIIITIGGVATTITDAITYAETAAQSPPTITSTDTAEVDGAGGETITLTGSGFVDGMTVEIENAGACTDVTVVSSASLTCTTPASDAGTWDIIITIGGVATTITDAITYADAAAPTTTVAATSRSIEGEVWLDSNGDATRDSNELPVVGAKVHLVGSTADPVDTDSDGAFRIDGVTDSNPSLEVTPPAGVSADQLGVRITSSDCETCTIEAVEASATTLPSTGPSGSATIAVLLAAIGGLAVVSGTRRQFQR